MKVKEHVKSTGATFTPTKLAEFLAEKLTGYVKSSQLKILDPACGDGELLISIGQKLSQSGHKCELHGVDSHQSYLEIAKERMTNLGVENFKLIKDNFLKLIDVSDEQLSLNFNGKNSTLVNGMFDLVIANPPYVRTQILGSEQAQIIAKKFNLKGRVDLYYPFLIGITESLRPNGLLGVITSNRYLSTRSGESVRKYLSENYEILELIDLGDTKLFNAAVLPAIFIGRKKKAETNTMAVFSKIYEETGDFGRKYTKVENIYDILTYKGSGFFSAGEKKFKKTTGFLSYDIASKSVWKLMTSNESQWVEKIESNAKMRVGDIFKVRVGIKSNADNVFIRDDWEKLDFKPEEELLKNLISQENIKKWGSTENEKLKVLYPHQSKDGAKLTIDLAMFPFAGKYLQQYENLLRQRTYLIEAGRKWYEIWVPQRPDSWKKPKLVFPDISLTPRFCYDIKERIVNGNCYWIAADNDEQIDQLLLVEGIANSNLMTKYHDLAFNNKLYSGRRRYFSQYVEKYPLPDVNSKEARRIVEIVKELNIAVNSNHIIELEHELENRVAESFNVEPIFTMD